MRNICLCLFLIFGLAPSMPDKSSDLISFVVKLQPGSESDLPRTISKNLNIPRQNIFLESIFRANNVYRLDIMQIDKKESDIFNALKRIPAILLIEPDLPVVPREVPNDPQFQSQWDMEIIEAPALWNFTRGGNTETGREIVVAVIDQGFQVDHEDLFENVWINDREIPGNEIDDDNNGYVDDYYGANIRQNNGDHPLKKHGTAVAGIIGAVGNNGIGIAGVNWNIKLMLLSETDRVSSVIEAYEYVLEQKQLFNQSNGIEGANVVVTNFSLGVPERFADEFPIWCGIYNTLGQEGVLSVSATSNDNVNIDEVGDMPSLCTSDYLIVVSNTTRNDVRAEETGYSPTHVDLGAPGDDSYTLDLSNGYGSFNGTSASSPHVAGGIALLYSLPCEALGMGAIQNPPATALRIKESVLNGVDLLPDLTNRTLTGGRLNILTSALELRDICSGESGSLDIVKIYPSPASELTTVVYQTPDFEDYELAVYDAIGRIVHREKISPPIFGEKTIDLDVADYPSGVYFVSITDAENRFSSQFVVNR